MQQARTRPIASVANSSQSNAILIDDEDRVLFRGRDFKTSFYGASYPGTYVSQVK